MILSKKENCKGSVEYLNQLEWIYEQLNSLSTSTLVKIIDELECEVADNEYKEMSLDVLSKARLGYGLSDKQKRVLVNIIGQRP